MIHSGQANFVGQGLMKARGSQLELESEILRGENEEVVVQEKPD